MTDTEQHVERIYIRQAAELLNRRMATLRKWEALGVLPVHLRSHRGERQWRYWTPDQIEGIQEWIRSTDRRPGKGLPHYNPTEEQLERAIVAMRVPRHTSNRETTAAIEDMIPDRTRNKMEREKRTARRKRPGS